MKAEQFNKSCTIARQAIKLVKTGKKREELSQALVEASRSAGNDEGILEGKFEKFYSCPNDENMSQAMAEAIEHNQRENGLARILDFYSQKKKISDDEKNLYMKALLMNGDLKAAVEMVKASRSLGWSYGLNVGLVFGCVAAAASGYETGAGAIKQVLNRGLDHRYAYSHRFAVADEKNPPLFFYNEILNGLKAANLSNTIQGKILNGQRKSEGNEWMILFPIPTGEPMTERQWYWEALLKSLLQKARLKPLRTCSMNFANKSTTGTRRSNGKSGR